MQSRMQSNISTRSASTQSLLKFWSPPFFDVQISNSEFYSRKDEALNGHVFGRGKLKFSQISDISETVQDRHSVTMKR